MKFTSKKAFTLVELLVVIVIIAILASIVAVSTGSARRNARDAKRVGDIQAVDTAMRMYIANTSTLPAAACADAVGASACFTAQANALVAAGYLANVPVDPLNTAPQVYSMSAQVPGPGTGAVAGGSCFVAYVTLESSTNNVLSNDINTNTCGSAGCGGTAVYCTGIK